MPTRQIKYLALHGHFYQPPRGNPFSSAPLVEPSAAPYRNWNERITAESYRPNAELGNFDLISFNLGETLAVWLLANAPETYRRILQADADHLARTKVGNAIAQPMHHTILPLDRRPDKVTQVRWGKAAFAHRYGRPTTGMWLPEMAVDYETLEVLVENGIEWTILTESQIIGKPPGSGPFWVDLPGGGRIKVFVRDESLSNDIAFNLGNFGGAGRWARNALAPRRPNAGPLTLIATDGETFGHHWPGEEQFLRWLMTYEAKAAGYIPITLAEYAAFAEPRETVTIKEDTAWSSGYGLGRWVTGSPDTPGDSYWKGALRRAMDNLRYQIDGVYRDEVARINGIDPITLRDAYIKVVLGHLSAPDLLRDQEVEIKREEDGPRLLKLIEAQYYRQRMYASCAFFFADLDDLATQYGIANAAYAIKLTRDATGIDLSADFRRDLRLARAVRRKTGQLFTAAEIFDPLSEEFRA
ncbi:MAG: hypothetical protein Kow00124_23060 [Anaerolineae bacterium]